MGRKSDILHIEQKVNKGISVVFVSVIVCLLLLTISIQPTPSNNNVSGISAEIQEIIDPNEYNPEISQAEAEQIISQHSILGQITWDNTTTWNLIQSYLRNQVYWQKEDETYRVYVDADNGDIVYYFTLEYDYGEITEQEASTLADQYILTFLSPIPSSSDRHQSVWESEKYNGKDADTGEIFTFTYTFHEIVYQRTYNNIPTPNAIEVRLDTAGNLCFYNYVWTMEMPPSTDPEITASEAITTAQSIQNGDLLTTTLEIHNQNDFWTNGHPMYGYTQGHLCWNVKLEYEEMDNGTVVQSYGWFFVDAIENEVIGGDAVGFIPPAT